MNFSLVHRQAAFLGGIAALVLGFVSIEILCVLQMKRWSDELLNQNLIQLQENHRIRTEIEEIKAMQSKISAMFVRLNDAVFRRLSESGQKTGRPRMRVLNDDRRPSPVQMFADAGLVVQPGKASPGESSAIFEAGSSRLEFQRLIPLLAEQENSNAFLYFDRIFINRPAAIQPFSELPTYLDTRFSIRILASR
jgi:hypothetical protein